MDFYSPSNTLAGSAESQLHLRRSSPHHSSSQCHNSQQPQRRMDWRQPNTTLKSIEYKPQNTRRSSGDHELQKLPGMCVAPTPNNQYIKGRDQLFRDSQYPFDFAKPFVPPPMYTPPAEWMSLFRVWRDTVLDTPQDLLVAAMSELLESVNTENEEERRVVKEFLCAKNGGTLLYLFFRRVNSVEFNYEEVSAQVLSVVGLLCGVLGMSVFATEYIIFKNNSQRIRGGSMSMHFVLEVDKIVNAYCFAVLGM
jgi:hypothetical protein